MTTRPARSALLALGLVIAIGSASCSSSADEVAPTPKPAPTVAAAAATGGFQMPKPDPKVTLDPVTQSKCDTLNEFQLFSYSAHVSPDRDPAKVATLLSGLDTAVAKVKAAIPELATSVDALAADGKAISSQPVSTAAHDMPPGVGEANTAVLQYLRNTCKYVD